MSSFAGVELGGTKCVCAFWSDSDREWQVAVFPTGEPDATLEAVVSWLASVSSARSPLAELGVASFGPLDLQAGVISSATPKLAWRGVRVVDKLETALGVPVRFDTDVNSAALAELSCGAARGCADVLYLTVGTGIGVGAVVAGRPVHGTSHPEMGHMRVPLHPADRDPSDPARPWPGNCVVHGNCWEGVASGPAMLRREQAWRALGLQPPDAEMLAGEYLALGIVNLVACYRPERLVVGGGVAARATRLERARRRARALLDEGYFPEAARLDELVVGPGLKDAAGVAGAVLSASGADRRRVEGIALEGLVAAVGRQLKAAGLRN